MLRLSIVVCRVEREVERASSAKCVVVLERRDCRAERRDVRREDWESVAERLGEVEEREELRERGGGGLRGDVSVEELGRDRSLWTQISSSG